MNFQPRHFDKNNKMLHFRARDDVIFEHKLLDILKNLLLTTILSILVLICLRLFKMKMMELFKTLLTNKILNNLFNQLVSQWFIILLIICRLQKQAVLIKYQPRCSVVPLRQLHRVLLRLLTCQSILIASPLTGRQQELFLCLRKSNGLC